MTMAKNSDKSKDATKPTEFSAFEALTRRLLTVPKSELDAKVRTYVKRKNKKRGR